MKEKSRTVHKTTYPHIVKTEGINGGAATIEGTRIAVWHVVGYYYELGMSVEAILLDWDYLKPAAIFSALAYYHDHRDEIETSIRADEAFVAELRRNSTSKVAEKLRG